MTTKTGTCPECGGPQYSVDPVEDATLYSIFGAWIHEHRSGCSQYPETTEVQPENL